MSLLMPDLERQLRDVVDARQNQPGRGPKRRLGAVLTFAAAGVALVVGAVALLLLRPTHHDQVSAAARGVPHAIPGQATAFEQCARGSNLVPFAHDPTDSTVSVTSGTIDGYAWDLRARAGQNGYLAVEDGRLILDGRAYSMCGGASNPAEFALVDKGSAGIVYGYFANPGHPRITLKGGGETVVVPRTESVLGGTFFIVSLPRSACSYPSLTLNLKTAPPDPLSDMHYFGFGACRPNQLVQVTGGHGNWSAPPNAQPRPARAGQGPVGPSLEQLLAHFAVLRRPQTPEDRSWRGGDVRGRQPDVFLTGLTRLVQTVGDGDRIFLTVDGSPRSELMTVNLVDKEGNSDGALYASGVADYTIIPVSLGERPLPPAYVARHHGRLPAALRARQRSLAQFGPPLWTSVVPDGVASVRWIFACERGTGFSCRGFGQPLVVNVPVHENVAAARIPATDSCANVGCRAISVTWYNAAGRAIGRYDAEAALGGSGPQPKPFAGAP
jgi:hypothetical protein